LKVSGGRCLVRRGESLIRLILISPFLPRKSYCRGTAILAVGLSYPTAPPDYVGFAQKESMLSRIGPNFERSTSNVQRPTDLPQLPFEVGSSMFNVGRSTNENKAACAARGESQGESLPSPLGAVSLGRATEDFEKKTCLAGPDRVPAGLSPNKQPFDTTPYREDRHVQLPLEQAYKTKTRLYAG